MALMIIKNGSFLLEDLKIEPTDTEGLNIVCEKE